VALVLRVSRLLAMAKDTCGLCPIVVAKVFLQLINFHYLTTSKDISIAPISPSIWGIKP